ncbi:MAG: hypothetical protein H6709_22770 [Kofleriaceae bacterium]|nr:hypothetical protein [Myxococcales bacterium]MCB9560934.1 hypothetical protein [Kofleriaceae bacterium]MCB9574906.1 hypothetical protein [Kofleriaceae bacterium]
MPIAVVVYVAVGLGFALVGRDRVRADGPFAPPVFYLVLMHAAGVVAPIALYFYAVHPAWSWMYAVDPANVPALAILPLVVGHAVVEIGAFYAGAMLVRAERRRVLLGAIAALGVVALIAVLVWRGRLGLDTSYAGYHAGRGRELMEVELGWALMVSMMASAGSIIYVMIELARDGRRVRAR